jgi:hypothetical protein
LCVWEVEGEWSRAKNLPWVCQGRQSQAAKRTELHAVRGRALCPRCTVRRFCAGNQEHTVAGGGATDGNSGPPTRPLLSDMRQPKIRPCFPKSHAALWVCAAPRSGGGASFPHGTAIDTWRPWSSFIGSGFPPPHWCAWCACFIHQQGAGVHDSALSVPGGSVQGLLSQALRCASDA